MKKALLLLVIASIARAAGTVSSVCAQVGNGPVWTVKYSWTADASAGTVPATSAPCLTGFNLQGDTLLQVETIPGSPAPTANYAITLTDAYSVDIAAGQLNALSSSVAKYFAIAAPPLLGTLTLNVSGNSVNSAQGTVVLWLAPGNYARRSGGGTNYANLVNSLSGSPWRTPDYPALTNSLNDAFYLSHFFNNSNYFLFDFSQDTHLQDLSYGLEFVDFAGNRAAILGSANTGWQTSNIGIGSAGTVYQANKTASIASTPINSGHVNFMVLWSIGFNSGTGTLAVAFTWPDKNNASATVTNTLPTLTAGTNTAQGGMFLAYAQGASNNPISYSTTVSGTVNYNLYVELLPL